MWFMAVRVQRLWGPVQGPPPSPPKKKRGGPHKETRTLVSHQPLEMLRLSLIWNSLAGSAWLCLCLLGSHGRLWLFLFIIALNVFLVRFPGWTCSAWSCLFPRSLRAMALADPHLLHAAGCAFTPAQLWVVLNVLRTW